MKKVFAIILSALVLCNMLTVTYANDVDTTAATKFAEKINALFPNSCTVSGNVVTLNADLSILTESLQVESGGDVVLDLVRHNVRADYGVDAIEICAGAKLTIKGHGTIYGGDGAETYKHEDGNCGIINKGTLIIEDANVYGGESSYNKNGSTANGKLYAVGGTAILNEGYIEIVDGRITGGDFNRANGTGIGGIGINNSGELVAEGGNINGGDGTRSDDGTEFWVYGGAGIKNSGKITLSNTNIRGGSGATYSGCAIENLSEAECFYAEGTFLNAGYSNYYGTLDENYIETSFLNDAEAELYDCNVDSVYNKGTITIDGESYSGYIENIYGAKAVIESADVYSSGNMPAIVNDGEMIINDGNIDGSYAQTQDADGVPAIVNKRDLTVNGGRIYGGHPFEESGKAGCGIHTLIASNLTINGGEIIGGGYGTPEVGILAEGNVTINKGVVAGGIANDWETFAQPISGEYTTGRYSVVRGSVDGYEYSELDGLTEYRYLEFEILTSAISLANKINSLEPGACYYEDDTVYLERNLTLPEDIEILPGDHIVFNLCGWTLKAKGENVGSVICVQEDAEVTICNGNIIGESINETGSTGGMTVAGIYNYGKLNLEGCTVKGSSSLGFDEYGGYGIYNHTTGVLEITDCDIYGGDGEAFGVTSISNSGTATINSGKFVGGASKNGVVAAVSSEVSVSQGAYMQESDDDISYSRVVGTNQKQYLEVIEESAATKLAEIIEGYSQGSCVIRYQNEIEITKPVSIDDVITIPEGDEVILNVSNLSCRGLYVPENAYLTLKGDGVFTGTEDAVVNDGTLDIRGGTYKGGPSGSGILNRGSLTVHYGTVIGGDGAAAISSTGEKLCLYEGEFIGGARMDGSRVQAIMGSITDGECIEKSSDGENYTMITAPEITAPYVVASWGTPTERAALGINLKYPNSCRYWTDEDHEEEKVVFVADCPSVVLEADGIVVELNGRTFGEIIVYGNIELTGKGYITDFLTNHRELLINAKAEIEGVIINHRNLVTEGEINGGILNREGGRVIVEGGTITGSAKNYGAAIYHDNNHHAETIINKGIVKGLDCGVNLMLREGEYSFFQVNGGAVIGENGPAVKARIIKRPSVGGGSVGGGGGASSGIVGGSSGGVTGGNYIPSGSIAVGEALSGGVGSDSKIETCCVYMTGGLLAGGEGYLALEQSGYIETDENVTLKISEDGINYTVSADNRTYARFVKAEGEGYVGISSFDIKNESYTTCPEGRILLDTEIQPQNATNTEILWTSSDESVAVVKNGIVYGVGIGEATITGTTVDGLKTVTRTVKVEEYSEPQKYYRMGTSNRIYDGATLNFDLEVESSEPLKGSIYVGIYEGSTFVRCEIFEVKSDRLSIDCAENQTVKVFWWNENLCPVLGNLGVPKS